MQAQRHHERSHYPSWGLETRALGRVAEVVPVLITPHGDWKLHRAAEIRPRPLDVSLPLMGIGNPPRSAARMQRHSSLPLMGIGNTCSAERPSPCSAPSLPLMGIGNSFCIPGRARLRFSLPLMGIGNSSDPGCPACDTTAHYPSWGLETVGVDVDNAVLRPLITPHGDWKHAEARALLDARGWSSLPLMGIGNTGIDRGAVSDPHCSLPLMGIGNASSASRSPSAAASLPLMGIGNSAGLRTCGRPGRTSLITPHGDWKRQGGGRPAEGHPQPLITPHGDWKPTPEIRWPRRYPSHYPSWGLETFRFIGLNRYRRTATAPPSALPDHRNCA